MDRQSARMITAERLLVDRGFRPETGGIFSYPPARLLLVEAREDVIALLAKSEDVSQKSLAWLKRFSGAARLTENGENWSALRQSTQDFFGKSNEMKVEEATEAAFAAFVAKIAAKDMAFALDDLKLLAMDVIARIMLDASLEALALDEEGLLFINETSLRSAFLHNPAKEIPRETIARLMQIKLSSVETLLRQLEARNSAYLALGYEGSPPDRRIAADLFSFFFGPADALALFLGWICRAWPQEGGQNGPQGDDFLFDVLKRRPPIPLLIRQLTEDVVLPSGKSLAGGEWLCLSLLGRGGADLDLALSAFSFGPRMCPGRNMAIRIGRAFVQALQASQLTPRFDAPERPKWDVVLEDGSHFAARLMPISGGNHA